MSFPQQHKQTWAWICSAQFRNLHNLEIALRILGILKLRANLEIAQYCCAISRLRSNTAQSQDCAISRFLTKPPLFHPTRESGTTGICYGVVVDNLLALLTCYGLAGLAAILPESLRTKSLKNLPLLIDRQYHAQ